MQVLVSTDNHIVGNDDLTSHVETVVNDTIGRFGDRITRVEVHLGDENSHKGGANDKRCAMEARLSGSPPITVTAQAATLDQAVDSAADKLAKTLDRTLERKYDQKGRTSFAGEETP